LCKFDQSQSLGEILHKIFFEVTGGHFRPIGCGRVNELSDILRQIGAAFRTLSRKSSEVSLMTSLLEAEVSNAAICRESPSQRKKCSPNS
jgi:hypothetical protein